jgi:hypothetical protein
MEYKVTVTVDGESWQLTNQGGKVTEISKRDENYIARIFVALHEAVKKMDMDYPLLKYKIPTNQ